MMTTTAKHGGETLGGEQNELLNLEAAADQLCVSKTTLYRMLDRGEVKGIKVGRQWRFHAHDLDSYLTRGSVATALTAMPIETLNAEVATIVEKLHLTGDEMPQVVDASLDQWEMCVLQLLTGIIKLARVQRASDIHLEVIKEGSDLSGLIRFRIDGVLHEIHRLPMRIYEALVMRIRIMASGESGNGGYLDASLRVPMGDDSEDTRISVLTTFLGEAVTIRLHSLSDISHMTIDQLGFNPDDLQQLHRWLQASSGLILTAGPSGCGKTTLMYKFLQQVAQPSRKVVTVEDPIEHHLPGVMQVEINAKTRNFASALRAFLRHDVDVIMVGEMRDLETLDLAVHSAENGHLVMTAVHVNNAVDTILRIVEVFPDGQQTPIRMMLANHVLGIVALRLVRVLCPACKEQYPMPDTMRERITALAQRYTLQLPDELTCYRAVGCTECGHTGFHGRTGIYEVLPMTPELREAFLHDAPREQLHRLTRGMRTLASEGIRKAFAGITTFDEIMSLIMLYEAL